jgi:hypothetical protein
VSPPCGGSSTARRIEPIGGSRMKVLSLCQLSAPSPFGLFWSRTISSGFSPYFGTKGGSILCSGDKERMREAIREIAPADVEHLDRYFAENKQKLELMKPVMENPARPRRPG